MKLTIRLNTSIIMNKGIVRSQVQLDKSASDPLLTTGSVVQIRAGEQVKSLFYKEMSP